ncbi:8439681e-e57d-48d4-9a5c-5802251d6c6c [Thermothielavioides terrestris]|jgi:2-polyprenyl-6-methoxyphenol hydroxylase-like FAD-dependent oxidoreductase|uniref:8439681e-e57d-48d4-9a5c-5802251d6c6c n=1 Tax=Thermothielavioides terrestris TaxID=2587410 RepID=A0A446BP18_9PEZI|nr:8439681e-e57d-48d4-9a5c-5802251d6c6c [Thermothielavioides terrestris]
MLDTHPNPDPPRPLRILISGAGIAGPALALHLVRLPPPLRCDITIVERHPDLRASGQQIDLRGQGIAAMRTLGIEPAVRAVIVDEPGLRFLDGRGRTVAYFGSNKTGKGAQTFSAEWEIMRGDLCRVLYAATRDLDGVRYLFGTTVAEFEQADGSVKVRLSDGTVGEYDLLVGCDGIGSRIRSKICADGQPDMIKPVGMAMALYTIPPKEGDPPEATWMNLPGRRYFMTRRDRPDCLRVYIGYGGHNEQLKQALKHGSVAQQKAAWADIFKHDMHQYAQVPRYIEGLSSPEADDFWTQELVQINPASWSQGRVVLVGDAGYCPSPLTGMGTSLALAGAYVLAGEIARACGPKAREQGVEPRDNIPQALKEYETVLRPFVQHVHSLPVRRYAKFGAPESRWAIALLRWLFWLIATLRIDLLFQRFASDDRGPWQLPDYPELSTPKP